MFNFKRSNITLNEQLELKDELPDSDNLTNKVKAKSLTSSIFWEKWVDFLLYQVVADTIIWSAINEILQQRFSKMCRYNVVT